MAWIHYLLIYCGICYIIICCIFGYNLWKKTGRNDIDSKIIMLIFLLAPLVPFILLIDFFANKISERNQERIKMSFIIFMRIVTFPLLILVKTWELVEDLVKNMEYPEWWARRIFRRHIHVHIKDPKLSSEGSIKDPLLKKSDAAIKVK